MNVIRELREKRGVSQSRLAQICNVHQTAVSQWEKGRTSPDTRTLSVLADYFEVSIDQLLGRPAGAKQRYFVPVLGTVRAGIPIEAVEDILGYEEITPEMASSGSHFALKINGDSMAPQLLPDDVVIVRAQPDINNGEIGVVLVGGMDATVKKVVKKGAVIKLIPLNPSYESTFIDTRIADCPKVTIVGKVVEQRRKY